MKSTSLFPRQRLRKSSLCLYLEMYEDDKRYPSLKMQVLTHQLSYHVCGSLLSEFPHNLKLRGGGTLSSARSSVADEPSAC